MKLYPDLCEELPSDILEDFDKDPKNQLTHLQRGGETLRYLYDKQGNLLEEQGNGSRKQYSYDAVNRQVGIAAAKADGVTEKLHQTNRYDGEGLRYETEENGEIIRIPQPALRISVTHSLSDKWHNTELSKAHPELFSAANMQAIADGKVPIVDDQFLQYFPQYQEYMYQELRHHHIGGGGQAMPIPQDLHKGFGEVHNMEKLLGIWGGIDQEIFSEMLQNIKDITIRTRNWKNMRIK